MLESLAQALAVGLPILVVARAVDLRKEAQRKAVKA